MSDTEPSNPPTDEATIAFHKESAPRRISADTRSVCERVRRGAP